MQAKGAFSKGTTALFSKPKELFMETMDSMLDAGLKWLGELNAKSVTLLVAGGQTIRIGVLLGETGYADVVIGHAMQLEKAQVLYYHTPTAEAGKRVLQVYRYSCTTQPFYVGDAGFNPFGDDDTGAAASETQALELDAEQSSDTRNWLDGTTTSSAIVSPAAIALLRHGTGPMASLWLTGNIGSARAEGKAVLPSARACSSRTLLALCGWRGAR